MKIKNSKIIKLITVLTIVATMSSSTVFAAWWGTPGYEWAREKRLTTLANNSALNNKVSHANFYSILIKYLQYKNVRPGGNVMQNVGASNSFNKAIDGLVQTVDEYISVESLSSQEYKVVATYIEHVDDILESNAALLSRDDLKSVYLYLSLAKYKAATLISEPAYKNLVLSNASPTAMFNVGSTKYKELIDYNIKPYYGDISRKEFLVLMFSLLSEQELSEEEIITQFNEAGVLIGYQDGGLWIENPLTYAEMFTFLRRFEIFDFNPEPETEENTEDSNEEIKEYN
ncbi:MAG: hypothetical protein IJX99_08805 [Clostridia bacterium]|nr:hypothetical protein [Clostridia bacterium]